MAVPIVDDMDGAVGGLEAIGIRDKRAIIEEPVNSMPFLGGGLVLSAAAINFQAR